LVFQLDISTTHHGGKTAGIYTGLFTPPPKKTAVLGVLPLNGSLGSTSCQRDPEKALMIAKTRRLSQ